MMENKKQTVPELFVKNYTYNLPEEKIAKYPTDMRDNSKLLVYNGVISTHIFSELADFIPANSTLVFNNSKVIRARIFFKKSTGATIEVFCMYPASPSTFD
ncbi:MAG: S-adenosylmethionine:tRNA ribosyltransferase-isomerase, partial [Prevotellaceae bacterium]|nr:S-adenosylmethionine:tRNA ribosyltransferase-isomerase [Prevotellaceae bacterium]